MQILSLPTLPKKLILLSLTTILIGGIPHAFAEDDAFNTCREKSFTDGKLECFIDLADKGNAQAQFALGALYEIGSNVKQDYQKAREYYQKVADKNYPKAQYLLGFLYYWGAGVKKDYKQAAYWYQKAAAQNYSLAQFQLGNLYELGQGVTKNEQQATSLWLKAAADSNTDANKPIPSTQQIEQLKSLIKKANTGNVKAETELALFYRDANWYKHATENVNTRKMEYTNDQDKSDWRQALKLLQKAASKNYAEAQYQLGIGYYNGELNQEETSLIEKGDWRDIPSNVTDNYQAAYWFKKAARQNHAGAQDILGSLYEEGEGVRKNIHKAIDWYGKACDNGYEEACSKTEIQDYIHRRD